MLQDLEVLHHVGGVVQVQLDAKGVQGFANRLGLFFSQKFGQLLFIDFVLAVFGENRRVV